MHKFGDIPVFPDHSRTAQGQDHEATAEQLSARPAGRPHLTVKRFARAPGEPYLQAASHDTSLPDKSLFEDPTSSSQDQSASLHDLHATADGVHIEVEAIGVYTSADYPDGFKWTQTIDTSAPLGGATSPYVDPRPNDDLKPFYWTDAEHATYPTTFRDNPQRPVPVAGTTTWNAILALNGVNERAKRVTAFDALAYGFTRDHLGAIQVVGPASVGPDIDRATLSSEFPGWTFPTRRP